MWLLGERRWVLLGHRGKEGGRLEQEGQGGGLYSPPPQFPLHPSSSGGGEGRERGEGEGRDGGSSSSSDLGIASEGNPPRGD